MKNGNSSEWTEKEWNVAGEKPEALSSDELKSLVKKLGIEFEGGIDSIKNKEDLSAKEQHILVLDEAPKNELLNEIK